MMFFKGLQWFEWLLIGTVIAVLIGTVAIWDKYEEQVSTNGGLTTENNVLTETVKYKDESATITDEVVADFIQEKDDAKEELNKSREGVIDDYINMAGATPGKPIAPEVKPVPKVVPQPSPPKAGPTEPDSDSIAVAARLGVLAERMHEHYCKAAPSRGTNCDAQGAAR